MKRVKQEVLAIHECDETVVRKQKLSGPGIQEYERESGGNELRLAWHDGRLVNHSVDLERVLVPETGAELVIRDMLPTALSVGAMLLLITIHALFGALLSLFLLLLLWVGRFGMAPALILARSGLLLLVLAFFALGLVLRFSFLVLLMRWFCLVGLGFVLCKYRSRCHEKQKQHCGADNSKYSHMYPPISCCFSKLHPGPLIHNSDEWQQMRDACPSPWAWQGKSGIHRARALGIW